jgi:hypothetical protein
MIEFWMLLFGLGIVMVGILLTTVCVISIISGFVNSVEIMMLWTGVFIGALIALQFGITVIIETGKELLKEV